MPRQPINELTQALEISERRRRETQRLSGVGFWELCHGTATLYWSEEIFNIYGLEPNSLVPSYALFASLIHDDDREIVEHTYSKSVETGSEYNIRYRIKSGQSTKWIEARGITLKDHEGNPERSIGTAQDISEIIEAQKANEFLATHDALTRLPNRSLFADRMNMAVGLIGRHNLHLAVLFIDLDHFKNINDQHGHDIGDEVLVGVARQLERSGRTQDTFARIGGDEFAGLIMLKNDTDILQTVNRVKQLIEHEYDTHAGKFRITASIGVTIYPQDNDVPDALLRHADHAMYEAKESGRSRICFFDSKKHLSNISRHQLLQAIEKAIADDEFELHFQPKVRLQDGKLAGAEALLRWFRPEGAFPPAKIIEAISGTSLEWELDNWVASQLIREIAALQEIDTTGTYSLNFNPSTIQNQHLPNKLEALLKTTEVPAEKMEIEILEVASITEFDRTSEILMRCKALGFCVSLDDFGTGFSSLTYFHALPIDNLKIDQYFVKSLLSDDNNLALVKSVLAIAKANHRPVTAEGVESIEIASALHKLGCDYAQGYGIAYPMSRQEYIKWITNWNPEVFTAQL